MTHDQLIEAMARAMAAGDSGPEGSALFDIHWAEFGDGYTKGAHAALAVVREAMEEPSDAMVDAMHYPGCGYRAAIAASPLYKEKK